MQEGDGKWQNTFGNGEVHRMEVGECLGCFDFSFSSFPYTILAMPVRTWKKRHTFSGSIFLPYEI